MQRIAVVGSGGSGKTYVSRALGKMLDVPVTHLDAEYYDEDWHPLPAESFATRQREIVSGDRWVIDGNHCTTLPIRLAACDTVVMMDVPTTSALLGVLWRQVRHGAGQHANGVHNRLNLEVLRYVVTYRQRMRPRMIAEMAQVAEHVDVVRLTSRRRARRWLRDLSARRSTSPVRDAHPTAHGGDDQ
ncbi:hypothetical protein Bra3105_17200 [Brachybacterium halotolerans subsp. kimchii]|uniref:hypothetical protein n=1 Tax=Brachybacterium halotolerans TaxID=2795215 RepID=UPI001E2D5CB3|nr:hypothetical protein [Brachybacterium halotolerans]UEJ82542.1 hypothetical protein Bra3105_17200 [Brachybacterium halotolerans subsp. kimchii]